MSESLRRIYLDNAATSWPKPQSVVDAISNFYLHHGSSAGRGVASDAVEIDRQIRQVRSELAKFINASHPDSIAFSFNGTDALNMAIRGVCRKGDHVIASTLEHNSVLRPLYYLQNLGMIDLTLIEIDSAGVVQLDQLEDSIINDTKLICVSHVSNVLGTIQPVEQIGRMEKPDQCLFLVDGAQSVGHIPIDVDAIGCDFFAASGHKGLMGPLGTGFLYSNESAIEQLEPFRLGGTGTRSEQIYQPEEMPFRLESGNLNAAGIIALGEGIQFFETTSLAETGKHLDSLSRRFIEFASDQSGIHVYSAPESFYGSGVVSFQLDSMPCSDVANVLDSQFGIQLRSGLHCSPLVHKSIGSDKLGGTVRMSVGHFNTLDDVDALTEALTQLLDGQ